MRAASMPSGADGAGPARWAASYVSVAAPRRTPASYSLSVALRNEASRVARPITRGRTPVASGSSVPVWPMRLRPSARRTRATTSCDVGPAGLSMTRTPSNPASSIFIHCSWGPHPPHSLALRRSKTRYPRAGRRRSPSFQRICLAFRRLGGKREAGSWSFLRPALQPLGDRGDEPLADPRLEIGQRAGDGEPGGVLVAAAAELAGHAAARPRRTWTAC